MDNTRGRIHTFLCLLTVTVETKNRHWFYFPAKGIKSSSIADGKKSKQSVCVLEAHLLLDMTVSADVIKEGQTRSVGGT